MSISKHPGIGELNPESLCYHIYKHLYNTFFNSQDKKDAEHPWGVTEGDETSIRLHNTAYGFADAISLGLNENGFIGNETLLGYLKTSGGNMSGSFTAYYGFEAGVENERVLYIYQDHARGVNGVRISGILDLGAESLYIGGKQFISYDVVNNTVILKSHIVDFKDSKLLSTGNMIFGDQKTGVSISSTGITIDGNDVYHSGNANLTTVDWKMKDGSVNGGLTVSGSTVLKGKLQALSGVELGVNNKTLLTLSGDSINATGFISFSIGFGIKINKYPVLVRINNSDIQLGALGGDLLLGSASTSKIRLQAHISTDDGEYTIVTKYGGGYFPDFFTARHNFGDVLISTFRSDSTNEGVIIHKRLRFNDKENIYLYGTTEGLGFSSHYSYIDNETSKETSLQINSIIRYVESSSLYRPLDKKSVSFELSTEADFLITNKPFEAKGYIGIDKSKTRLTDGSLFFTESNYLLSTIAGIKHNGNAIFLSDLSSELFSSGFAGSGWAILKNKMTGNIAATFDELTIRKKMRIYELEVQKTSATNGSLWISDSCSGDTVIKL